MKNEANKLFEKAIKNLNEANKELNRPEEDIVTYSVCKNSQFAIENYLKGYLYQNGINPSDLSTINQLYEACKNINKKFKAINLSDFECKSYKIDAGYCNEVSKVNNCFDSADSLDTFLRKEQII